MDNLAGIFYGFILSSFLLNLAFIWRLYKIEKTQQEHFDRIRSLERVNEEIKDYILSVNSKVFDLHKRVIMLESYVKAIDNLEFK